jgi:PAS domain S-box-containing protein
MACARDGLIEKSLVAQLARAERSSILEAMFNQLSDAVLLYGRDFQIVGVNHAAERLFGMLADEIIGQSCHDLFHRAAWDAGLGTPPAVSRSAGLESGTFNLDLKNGRQRAVVVRAIQIRDDPNVIEGVVATIKNITGEPQASVGPIIAESKVMLDLLSFIRKVAVSEATSILLEGENGTGKDLIAKTLHCQSLRQSQPFLAINCAAIPEALLESELFGYEKGAFTDARAQKRGLFELADKGTLFLDEIGEMPLALQVKILRALEDQTFRRLGGLQDIHVDIRVVAATNSNLREAVTEGAFRRDLYYRLNVIQLVVPPLRERPEDILPLAHYFVEQYNAKFKRRIGGISPEAENHMLAYNWPGNVRELRNAIERAMILEDTAWIQPESLHISAPIGELAFAARAGATLGPCQGGGKSLLFEQERRLLMQAIESSAGNQTQAARLLRISRDTLRYKMKKFNLSAAAISAPVE